MGEDDREGGDSGGEVGVVGVVVGFGVVWIGGGGLGRDGRGVVGVNGGVSVNVGVVELFVVHVVCVGGVGSGVGWSGGVGVGLGLGVV